MVTSVNRDLSNPSLVFLPDEDEWYKAAYHQPASQGGDADDYWLYATMSNSVPDVALATFDGDVANPGSNVANYARAAEWGNPNGNGDVTTVGSAGSASFYGAFDMSGNVKERNETPENGTGFFNSDRGIRGGSWAEDENELRSSFGIQFPPQIRLGDVGFRLAASPPTFQACVVCSDTDRGASDGLVNTTDLLQLLAVFGTGAGTTPGFDPADLNCDGSVNTADLLQLLSDFGNAVSC